MEQWRNEKWAKNIPDELAVSLDNFEHDDNKAPTLEMAIEEAKYIISLHYEGGTVSNSMLSGEDGPEAREEALQTIRDCKRFAKKYSKTLRGGK